MRALLAAVLAAITAEFFAFMSASRVLSAASFNSFSFGWYLGSAVRVAISCAKLSMSLSKLCCDTEAVRTGSAPSASAFASGFAMAFARLPWILLLDVLTSSTVCVAASVAAIAFTTFVVSALSGLNVISRALVALSYAVFAVFTDCTDTVAALSWLMRAAVFKAAFVGLYVAPYAAQKLMRSSKLARFFAWPVSIGDAMMLFWLNGFYFHLRREHAGAFVLEFE